MLGTSLTIKTDEDPEHMSRVIRYLEQKIADTEKLIPIKDPLKLSVLCSLLLTDELLKERAKISEKGSAGAADSREIERITENMIRLIESTVEE